MWQNVIDDPATEEVEEGMVELVKSSVDSAMNFWKKASSNRMKFVAPEFYFGKPGTALTHCNPSADIKAGMKIAGLKTIPKGTHLLVANSEDSCGYGGLGSQGGNTLNLRSLGDSTLIHELGHNFGFLHSSSIYCKDNNYSIFNSRNCEVVEYGDWRDVMGDDEYCPTSTLSATQRATIFYTPFAKDIKLGTTYTVDESRQDSANIVYSLNVKGTWFFFEYFTPREQRCMSTSSTSYTPEIQVRMIGPDWAARSGQAIGPMLVDRYDVEPGTPTTVSEDANAPEKITLHGFKAGEKFKLPTTKFFLNVISTGATSAEFSVTTS